MKKWKWLAASGVMAALGLGVGACLIDGSQLVLAQQAKSGDIIALDCSVALIDVALLATDRPGILDYMEITEGDDVKANQKVAGLKDDIARAALKTATEKANNNVQTRYAEKATQFAEVELKIAEDANRRLPGSVPKLEIEKLTLGVERGRLQTEQAQFEQAVAKYTQEEAAETLRSYEVLAPFDGKVSRVLLKRGMAVRQGDPILEVVSTDRFKVEGYLSGADSYKVSPGDPVELIVSFRDASKAVTEVKGVRFPGKIKYVDPRVEVSERVKVLAYVENVDGLLKEGFRGQMVIRSAGPAPFRPK